jgi:hypothetical protein
MLYLALRAEPNGRGISLENVFEAKVDFYDFKKYVYTCIYFPDTIIEKLPMDKYPRLRINATIDSFPCKGALMPDKVGSNQTMHLLQNGYTRNQKIWYFQVPHKLLSRIHKKVGDIVDVEFTIANQSEVDIHPDVEEMLANDEALQAIWERLTPGKQRSLMYPILAAKTDITLEKRISAFTDQLADL